MGCTIDKYMVVLTHELIRYDMAQSRREAKRGRVNIYRLGHLLEAANRVRASVEKKRGASGDDAALRDMRVSLEHEFLPGFAPAKRVIQQIDSGTCKIK